MSKLQPKTHLVRQFIIDHVADHPADIGSTLEIQHVFEKFTAEIDSDSSAFSKTHVPISLAQYGADNLVSRSQARRVLARFERFKEVLLDFSGVEFIGQAFADELFRVYKARHPEVDLIAINVNSMVGGMIQRAIKRSQEKQPELFSNGETPDSSS